MPEPAPRFYRLRQDLVARYGPPRRSVRPDSRIGALVPVGPARRTWPQFAREVGLPVPGGWPFSTRFPDPETTLRELVPFLVRPPFSTDDRRVDEQAVWAQIVKIISEQAGVDAGEIQHHTHYINDLHFD